MASAGSPRRKVFPHITELLAVSTGFAACLMMSLAFLGILVFGEARFIEPNPNVSILELTLFIAGGASNMAAAVRLAREQHEVLGI